MSALIAAEIDRRRKVSAGAHLTDRSGEADGPATVAPPAAPSSEGAPPRPAGRPAPSDGIERPF